MDTRHRTALLVTGLLSLFTALLSIVASIAASTLPDAWKPHLWLAWPVFFGATIIFIILAV